MKAEELLQKARTMQDEIVKHRRRLHEHPEVGFALKSTVEYVEQQLAEMGYEPKKCGRSGLTATVGTEQAPVFLLRADMDGLAINEESDVAYASKNENMHACGHDMHTAMLLGAAKLLKEYEAELQGTVKLMFQPAEELLEGSKDMIDAGVLEQPKVDAGLMIHVSPALPLPAGSVIIAPAGVSAPAADFFEITITGKGCHGSSPYQGIDPMIPMAHMVLGLQEITTRELPANQPATLTIGSINGGTSANVIPDTIILTGTHRCYDDEIRAHLKQRVAEICQGIATAFRADCKVQYTSGCPTLLNDTSLVEFSKDCLTELLGLDMTFSAEDLMKAQGSKKGTLASGSEDFAYVSHAIPTVMFALAAGSPADGYQYPLHHPKVTFDDEALCYGSAVHAYVAWKWLNAHGNS